MCQISLYLYLEIKEKKKCLDWIGQLKKYGDILKFFSKVRFLVKGLLFPSDVQNCI